MTRLHNPFKESDRDDGCTDSIFRLPPRHNVSLRITIGLFGCRYHVSSPRFLTDQNIPCCSKTFHLIDSGPVSVKICEWHIDTGTGFSRNTHLPSSTNYRSSNSRQTDKCASLGTCKAKQCSVGYRRTLVRQHSHFFVFQGLRNCRLRFLVQFWREGIGSLVQCYALLSLHWFVIVIYRRQLLGIFHFNCWNMPNVVCFRNSYSSRQFRWL